MTSRHLVDPELLETLAAFPPLQLETISLPELRAGLPQNVAAPARETFSDVALTERSVPGPGGAPNVRVLIFTPAAAGPHPAFLHIHGGGYILGVPEMSSQQNSVLARMIPAVVVSVDYRLAPETPFPGAVEDCYAALRWLSHNAPALGADPRRIAIGGESAGAGLAAALALLARDRGEVAIVHQQLVYPMLDDRTGSIGAPHPYTGEFVWTAQHNRFGWQALLGRAPGGADVSPYAAAARAQDLRGLPPAYIAVGALDLFLEENMDYARRLMRAGVSTELHVYPGAYHGFFGRGTAAVTLAATRDYLLALQRALKPQR